MSEPILRVENLVTEFATSQGSLRAVDNISFDLYAGETLGIVGESGSGKSTTMLSALGLIPKNNGHVSSGRVLFKGEDLLTARADKLRKIRGKDIGMIFQDPMSSLNPVFTVGNQLTEAIRLHRRVSLAQAKKRTIEVLELVGVPSPQARYHQYPHQYSGGMRQRAMIAMAIINDPAVLVADEPTTALDVTIQAQVLDVLGKAQAETGSATVIITHDLGVIAETVDRVLVMYGGRIVEQGDVHTIFAAPKHPYTAGLLESMPQVSDSAGPLRPIPGDPPSLIDLPSGCAFHPRCALSNGRAACSTEKPPLYEAPNEEHRSACHFWGELRIPPKIQVTAASTAHVGQPAASDPVLVVSDLRKHFKGASRPFKRTGEPVRAVDGVSFELHAGETLGLVGESGSGKTTVGKAVLGLVGDVDGSIVFVDQEISEYNRQQLRAVRRDLQMVFQDPYSSLDPRMNIGQIIAEPLSIHRTLNGEAIGTRAITARVEQLLERVGLPTGYSDRHPHQLSGGQRQRVGIARALALNPKVLVLDEPVSALDVSVQAQVINLLEDLQQEHNLAYLFIAHDLSVVHHVSDRVAIMYLGKVMEIGDKQAIYENPTHPYTQALLSAVPIPDPSLKDRGGRIVLVGDIPNPADPPSGCVFRTRCWKATDLCGQEVPALADRLGVGHPSACHYPETLVQPGPDSYVATAALAESASSKE